MFSQVSLASMRRVDIALPGRLAAAIAILIPVAIIGGCRGEDVTDTGFIKTPEPDKFNTFINPEPGVSKEHIYNEALRSDSAEIDNLRDFPAAYYNTIDPQDTRTTLDDWKIENGFLKADGTEPACSAVNCCIPQQSDLTQCEVITTHVSFRNTKDQGYGRDMFMRHNVKTSEVAVYVENYQVNSIEGLPYGPLNLEALIRGAHEFQFGTNAIEFSTYPYGAGEPSASLVEAGLQNRKFTKFYSFAGRNQSVPGVREDSVDLIDRGLQPMPVPCIVCHGGRGGTIVSTDSAGKPVLEPTLVGELPGDVQAYLQTIEFDTLQFSTGSGFTRADHSAGIDAINRAVLASYQEHKSFVDGRHGAESGYWDPALAIEILSGRLQTNGSYDATFVPVRWRNSPGAADSPLQREALYREIVSPNCHVCHSLRGSGQNNSVSFPDFDAFKSYAQRIDHLVFERGLMPSGLLNYRELWDLKDPVLMADVLELSEKIDQGTVVAPGAPAAHIAAPLIASVNTDIAVSGRGSGFADRYVWSVQPASATVAASSISGEAVLLATEAVPHTLTLTVYNDSTNTSDSATFVVDTTLNIDVSGDFYGAGGISELLQQNCVACHSEGALPAMPVVFNVCQATDQSQRDLLYRHILARVNVDSPLDSMMLRKPGNGITDMQDPQSEIPGYHSAGRVLTDEGLSKMIHWINRGAPVGLFDPSVDLIGC